MFDTKDIQENQICFTVDNFPVIICNKYNPEIPNYRRGVYFDQGTGTRYISVSTSVTFDDNGFVICPLFGGGYAGKFGHYQDAISILREYYKKHRPGGKYPDGSRRL